MMKGKEYLLDHRSVQALFMMILRYTHSICVSVFPPKFLVTWKHMMV